MVVIMETVFSYQKAFSPLKMPRSLRDIGLSLYSQIFEKDEVFGIGK